MPPTKRPGSSSSKRSRYRSPSKESAIPPATRRTTVLAFVDTNVLLYWRDANQPQKQPVAREWLEHLWNERAGRLSTQVLAEYYTNVCRKLSKPLAPEQAWKDVTTFLGWNPRPVDSDTLTRAREIEARYQLNWWDCQIVAAAQLEDCSLLLTEDLQDGMSFGTLTVRN